MLPQAAVANTARTLLSLGLRLVAYVLALESIAELVQAWGELTRPMRGVLFVLLAGDPPTFVGCVLIARGAGHSFTRRAILVALASFAVGFILLCGDFAAFRIAALRGLQPLFAQAWQGHALNACEVVGCFALMMAAGDLFVRKQKPRPPSFFVTAACLLGRAVTGLVATEQPAPVPRALVALTSAATFASAAWLLLAANRLLIAPDSKAPRRVDGD